MAINQKCVWCGATEPDSTYRVVKWWTNRLGELFCSRVHKEYQASLLRGGIPTDESR